MVHDKIQQTSQIWKYSISLWIVQAARPHAQMANIDEITDKFQTRLYLILLASTIMRKNGVAPWKHPLKYINKNHT